MPTPTPSPRQTQPNTTNKPSAHVSAQTAARIVAASDGEDAFKAWCVAADSYDLLSSEEEQALGQRIRRGMVPPHHYGPTSADALAAWEALVNANLRLVLSIAGRYNAPHVTLADLCQAGCIGLMEAARRYDPTRGKFSTVATWWIRQSVGRERMVHGRMIRVPIHVYERRRQAKMPADALSLDVPARADWAQHGDDPTTIGELVSEPVDFTEALADALDNATVRAGLELVMAGVLTARERRVLALRFGWDDSDNETDGTESLGGLTMTSGAYRDTARTLDAVGAALGVTRERARQIEARALRILRSVLTLDPATGAVGVHSARFQTFCRAKARAEAGLHSEERAAADPDGPLAMRRHRAKVTTAKQASQQAKNRTTQSAQPKRMKKQAV